MAKPTRKHELAPNAHSEEKPRFSVHFHAEADSPSELHRKMGKAFSGPKEDETRADRKRRGGSKARGRRDLKRLLKKGMRRG